MNLKEVFINNLKFYRKQKGLTQNELTLALDKSYNYINSIEQGKMMPSFEAIEKICEILEIKPSLLFDENASPENIKTFSKEEYIRSLSDKLFDRLKNAISTEIQNTLK